MAPGGASLLDPLGLKKVAFSMATLSMITKSEFVSENQIF